jgi:pimeloyl-ACP methyl ester carboxylesterase/quercetin dioxygenase-like cupin family protein
MDPNVIEREVSLSFPTSNGSARTPIRHAWFAAGAFMLPLAAPAANAQQPTAIVQRALDVNGLHLSYLTAGAGDPVILLHGYAETSHMWRPLITHLAKDHLVIAPDLRGFGDSAKPEQGYDKKTMAQDVHALALGLGVRHASIVGHDIGLMVAYAYAAQFPAEVERVALMDAFLPGVGDWKSVWLMRDLWHFHFGGVTGLALVAGRERTYLEHFWNDFAADPKHSVSEADRQLYAAAYAQPGAMRAGFEVFRAFEQDAVDFAGFAQTRLTMPMLVLSGQRASGDFLIQQGRLVADRVEGALIQGSGHWLMEEAPEQVVPRLLAFLDVGEERRLSPTAIAAMRHSGPGAGSSGVAGIETTVLAGDPSSPGLYTIQLRVPPNTRIEAHGHRDERAATVVSGTWYFGYGDAFAEAGLTVLPAGSFYTEPANRRHFAKTLAEPVVLYIIGYGPTDTKYTATSASAAR